MRSVFADTSYWIAILDPRDQLREQALTISDRLGSAIIVTSQMVLVELLNSFSATTPVLRHAAAELVERLRRKRGVVIRPQTPEQFENAFLRYSQATDKQWILTDCVSFQIMEVEGIESALSYDRH